MLRKPPESVTPPLDVETKYCFVLAQPVPPDGMNLPVFVAVRKYGVGQIEYGIDLPERDCTRVPVVYNNAGELCDVRRHTRRCG